MSEFCKDCFLKYNPECKGYSLRLSKEKDLCEGCGQMKRVVDGYGNIFDDLIGLFSRNKEEEED